MWTSYRLLKIAVLALIGYIAMMLASCGGSSGTVPNPTPSPSPALSPTVTALSPSSVTAGSSGFTLTVNGANYVASSVVQWNGSPRTTSFVSTTQLQANITSTDIAAGALETVTVANPSGQGGVSNAFTLTANNPTPSISGLNPGALAAGGQAFTLTVTGSNFVPTSAIQFNGAARPTTFISSTVLQAAVSSADIAKVGLSAVTVFNPAPAGGTSSSLSFTSAFPPPRITLLQPSSAVSGGAGFTISVTGTNFVPSSVVEFNGNARTTTFVSSTQLQAAITAADIATIGVANVTVVNVVTNPAIVTAANAGIDPTTSIPSTFFTGATGGPGFAQVIVNQASTDISYDSSQQVIYVSVPSTAGTNPNTISVLSLANAQIASSQAVGKNPGILAMSGDGQFLYAGIDGSASVQRFTLPGPVKDISIPLGSDPFFGPFFAQDLQVAPGFPHTLAVTLANSGVSPSEQGGVAIFDDATQRPTKFPGGGNLVTSLQWGPDATKLFGSDIFNGLDALSVNASGATLKQSFSGVLDGDRIHFAATNGLLYGNGGEAVQSANGLTTANFNVRGPMVVDPVLNAAFFAPQFSFSGATLEAFDLTRFTLNRSLTLSGVTGTPQRMIRWGQNGLAFNTSSGEIVIVAGNFLDPIAAPSTGPIPTPTPTPTPNPNPQAPAITLLNPGSAVAGSGGFTMTVKGTNFTSSSAVQFNGSVRSTTFISATQLQTTINAADVAAPGVSTVRVVDPANGPSAGSSFLTGTSGGAGFAVTTVNQPSQDIVLDPSRQAIYLSVPNTVPQGNSIAVLDLATAQIIGTQFAGSNPDVLSISADSQFLYAGIDGNATVRRFALPALSMDISYPLGSDLFGPFFALDLQAAPGAPHTSAVSLGIRGSSPSALGGITIFDDATPRPTIAKGFGPGGGGGVIYDSLQWGADATSLSAANLEDSGEDFYRLSVNASGVSLAQDLASVGSGRIHFDRGTNLMYGETGRAVDPATGLSAGIFADSGLMVPDSSLNTAFFLTQPFGSTTATIHSFDLTHFTSVGSIMVPNVNGQAKRLIRWGQNGLAFNTTSDQVVLVGGSFLAPVPTAFPAPAPLPTPAPTPAPGAPVISLLTPSSAIAGGASFTMTVTGTNFDPAAVVQFNGTALPTTFSSSTQLQATVPAADIASPGTAVVTVANPVTNGGASAGSTFFTGSTGGNNFAVSVISQPANDLIFDPLHQVILISVPGASPTHGNTISALDPSSETIISSQFAGSEPGVLALSDDSQFLYAGINGAAKVQRFTLPALGVDASYSLGSGGFINGSNIADDLQVAPGAPHTTAVTTQGGNITIFDDATPRTGTVVAGTAIQWGIDSSTLLSTGGFFGDLLTFSATAGGLAKTNDFKVDIGGNRIHFDRGNHLLWAENGHVVDPTAGSPVAVLAASGPTVPDSRLNAAFVLNQLGPSVTLSAFDMTHFTEMGSITIPNVIGNARRLIRWGQNGLAFNTDSGQIYLVAGNFVSPVVTATGPATPLPTPPVPAANAPVISRLSPSFAVAGGAAMTITVTGVNFDPAAVLQFNGSALTPTVISATSLQATIPSTALANPGTATITVLNPVSAGGASAGFTFFVGAKGGTGFAVTELNQPANDLVFDPAHQVILLSVPSTAGAIGNTISAIDLSGNVISSQFAGSAPNVLALSGNNTLLYSGIDGASKVQRFVLPSLTPDVSYSLGGGGFSGLSTARDLQVAPGAAQTSAVVIKQDNPSGQIMVFDDATQRSGTVTNGNSIQWGAAATTLYSSNAFGSDLLSLSVNPSGVSLNHDFPSFLTGRRIHFDPVTALVYSDDGAVMDPSTGLVTATFRAGGLMVVDPVLNAAFFLQLPIVRNVVAIDSFDLTHFVKTGTILIGGVTGNPQRLIRWGQNGLAFNTDDGHMFLIGGDFVSASTFSIPPATPLPTPAPFTPGPSKPTISSLNPGSAAAGGSDVHVTITGTNFTASSVAQFNGTALTTSFTSATALTATIPAASIATAGTALLTVMDPANGASNQSTFLVGGTAGTGTGGTTFAFSTINQTANDLIFDPVHQVFLVSVPSSATSLGNTVDALDLSGNLISTQFAGSEPGVLGLSGDGQFLYSGINGAGKAQRFSLPAFTTDINYSLGNPNSFGPAAARDLQVAPGSPHTVAYSTGSLTDSFVTDGVVVFDDQTPRTNRPFNDVSSIQWGVDTTALFGEGASGELLNMAVNANGVTGNQAFFGLFGTPTGIQIRFLPATGFVYGNDGTVVNPSTGIKVGAYTLATTNGPSFVVPDSTLGKAFVLTQSFPTPQTTVTLQSFDLKSFSPISSITLAVNGTAQNLVRWGTNGLAFRTNQGQIVLVAGTFIN